MKPLHPLTRWRKRQGWTQRDVAAACGLSQSMIAMVEKYERIPLRDALERLLQVTALPTDAFIRPERFLEEHPTYPGMS
jgi:transcriptional regulator with XRE-family HTH domain